MGFFSSSDDKKKELKDGFFKRGVLISSRDTHRGANEGLGTREIKGFFEENSSPYGRRSSREMHIRARAEEAQKRAKAKKDKERKDRERAARAKKNKSNKGGGWFDSGTPSSKSKGGGWFS